MRDWGTVHAAVVREIAFVGDTAMLELSKLAIVQGQLERYSPLGAEDYEDVRRTCKAAIIVTIYEMAGRH